MDKSVFGELDNLEKDENALDSLSDDLKEMSFYVKNRSRKDFQPLKLGVVNVQDPFELNRNVTRGVQSLVQVMDFK